MKTQTLSKAMFGIVLIGLVTFSSCKKSDCTADSDDDTTEAADQSSAETISNDILSIGSMVTDENNQGNMALRESGTAGSLASCAVIKRDTVLRIDSVFFSNSSCLDGRVRNGILVFDYSSSVNGARHYRNPGFICEVRSIGYTVDGHAVNIVSKRIENTTPYPIEAGVNLTWTIKGQINVVNERGTHELSFTRYKTLLNTSDANVYHGQSTPISWNLAKIAISGEANGTGAGRHSFSMKITKALVRDFGGCLINNKHPFIEGTMEFTPNNRATRTVDFGNGNCDNEATVTVKGKTKTITLK